MNRIDRIIEQLKTQGRKMLSPYITAGDPEPAITVKLMHELVSAGADLLEIGIPFSDPMAEGPVIQQAMERALIHSVGCDDVLDMIKIFRQTNQTTPVVLMGYMNPIEQYGYERFAKQAVEAGVDGTIWVDLPPEESAEMSTIWKKQGLYPIYLCSPTTTNERMALINQFAQGYLYYVSLKGVTGADTLDISLLKSQYIQRKAQSQLPLMVGFGIKTAEMAAEVARFADGVIVGAALVTAVLSAYEAKKEVFSAGGRLIRSMRDAMDNNGIKA